MQLPVVVLSGIHDPSVVREVMALGAFQYLHKPVDVDVLDAALRRALNLPVEPPAAEPPTTPTPSEPPAPAQPPTPSEPPQAS
jgi:DNA-binding NarL/FixJ family response regulator